eukprot:1908690-Pyramimonas_sp.AAC.1
MTGHTGPECTFAHRGAKPPQMASRRAGEVVVTQRLRPTDPRGQSVRPSTGGVTPVAPALTGAGVHAF